MAENNINVAIAGLGTVGTGFFKILSGKSEILSKRTDCEINIFAASARNKNKDRGINLDSVKWYDNPLGFAEDDNIDVVIELIGGDEGVARDLVEQSLKNGKHVVTANKALIAKHGFELAKIAEENNLQLLFDAAVAGGVPIIKNLKESLVANNISKISGILNGTCNFIISKMSDDGRSFEDVLKEAQDKGYAEADPTFDVDGIDAAHKLTIISAIAFGIVPDFEKSYIEGIRNLRLSDIKFAEKLGYNIKLLAICNVTDDGKIEQRVHPVLIDCEKHELANVKDALGGLKLECDELGPFVMTGAGAGMSETASSVVGDVADVAAGRKSFPFGASVSNLKVASFKDITEHKCEYYLNFTVKDEDGVLSSITSILSKNGVGFEKVNQEPMEEGNSNLVIITHDSIESNIISALKEVSAQIYSTKEPVKIRIEK